MQSMHFVYDVGSSLNFYFTFMHYQHISLLIFCFSGILSGNQADQSCASAKQPSQSGTLAPAHLHELHLPTQPSHPQIPPLPSEEVRVFIMDGALMIKNNIHKWWCNKCVFVAQGAWALSRHRDWTLRLFHRGIPEEDQDSWVCSLSGGDRRPASQTGDEHHCLLPWRRLLQDLHQFTHHSWRG